MHGVFVHQAPDLLLVHDPAPMPERRLHAAPAIGLELVLDRVHAGKPFAQRQRAGMRAAVMDEIMRQRDPALKEAVEASLAGDVKRTFAKLGHNIAEVTLYVEISRARDRAELVSDDKAALRETLEAVTGERIAALEAVGGEKAKERVVADESGRDVEKGNETPQRTARPEPEKAHEPKSVDRGLDL